MSWENEEWKSIVAGARRIQVPPTGSTEPVLLADVLERKVWFDVSGIYTLRDADGTPMFVSETMSPLSERLRTMRMQRQSWGKAEDVTGWTVTLERLPVDRPERHRIWQLIETLKPTWNPPKGRRRKVRVPA